MNLLLGDSSWDVCVYGIIWISGYRKEGCFEKKTERDTVRFHQTLLHACNHPLASARHFPRADSHVCKAIAIFARRVGSRLHSSYAGGGGNAIVAASGGDSDNDDER